MKRAQSHGCLLPLHGVYHSCPAKVSLFTPPWFALLSHASAFPFLVSLFCNAESRICFSSLHPYSPGQVESYDNDKSPSVYCLSVPSLLVCILENLQLLSAASIHSPGEVDSYDCKEDSV